MECGIKIQNIFSSIPQSEVRIRGIHLISPNFHIVVASTYQCSPQYRRAGDDYWSKEWITACVRGAVHRVRLTHLLGRLFFFFWTTYSTSGSCTAGKLSIHDKFLPITNSSIAAWCVFVMGRYPSVRGIAIAAGPFYSHSFTGLLVVFVFCLFALNPESSPR